MNALAFLAARQIKNFFLDLLHHPAKLATYAVCIALLVLTLAAPASRQGRAGHADLRLLQGGYLAVLIFFGLLQMLSAFKSGASFFRMYDVNFLFVSPLSPKSILWYGMARQAAVTLLSFLFLLFYNGMLVQSFGLSGADTAALVAGLIFFVFFTQLLSLLLYSFLNGRSGRQRAAKAALAAYFVCMAAAAFAAYRQAGGGQEGLLAAASSPYLAWFPAFGWTAGAVSAMLRGDAAGALAFSGLMLALTALCLFLFVRSDPDYYEDVLQNAQTRFEAAQSAKGRRFSGVSASLPRRAANVGGSGIGRGWGASAFFFKHLREARRRSRFVFLSFSTAIIFAGNAAAALVLRSMGSGDPTAPSPDQMMFFLLAADVYLLFLMDAAGDWSRELQKPYIYLVPEPPFAKLFWASLTTVLKPAADGVLFFSASCAALGAAPSAGAACVLLYASFGFLFTAGNILSQRLFGSMANRGLTAALYLFLLLALCAPGIGLAFAVYSFQPAAALSAGLLLAGLTAAGWNIAVSLAVFFVCRNLLSSAEMR